MRKRVAHIDFHYDMLSQEHGSAQKVIQSFLNNLEDFESLSISVSTGIEQEILKDNVKYYTVKENNIKNKIFNKILRLDLFTYNKMINIINKEQPEILHFHNRHNLADKIYPYLKYKPKVVCHYHLHFKNPFIPKCCNLILGVSKATMKHIVNVSQTKVKSSYVLNPVSFDLSSMQNVKKMNNKKEEDYQIKLLFGAGDNKIKGYNEIIESLYKLNELKFNYVLYICGNKKELKIDPKLNVQTKGFLSSQDFYLMMKECDILLFPSYDEPFGLTVVEGMYNCIKVLSSSSGGIIEILGEGYPYYCSVRDSDSIVENILKFNKIDNNEEEKLYGFYRHRLELFNPKIIAKTLSKEYKELLDEN